MGPLRWLWLPSKACLYLQPHAAVVSIEMSQDEYNHGTWVPKNSFFPLLLWKIINSGGDVGENLKSGEVQQVNEGSNLGLMEMEESYKTIKGVCLFIGSRLLWRALRQTVK